MQRKMPYIALIDVESGRAENPKIEFFNLDGSITPIYSLDDLHKHQGIEQNKLTVALDDARRMYSFWNGPYDVK